MFAPNRHYKLMERKNTRYTQIPFQEFKINQFHQIFLYFPSFIETISRCLCSCARLRHTLVICQNISRTIFYVRRSFVVFRWHSKVIQSPSHDSILSYWQSDVCAHVCDLGTLGSLVIFFSYNMNHNNLKYRKIADDFCYIQKSLCSMKEDFFWGGGGGGGWGANFGPLVQNLGQNEIIWTAYH